MFKTATTKTLLLEVLLIGLQYVSAQAPPVVKQSTGFNSSFKFSDTQIQEAQLSAKLAASIEIIVNFDRSQLAYGGPQEDEFYRLSPIHSSSKNVSAGTLLKLQHITNVTGFALPPNTALSRIQYTTTNLNGTVVPTSAFILWPFAPRRFNTVSSGAKGQPAPTVLWTHGTSGFFASAAPSAHRALWYGDAAPFALALDGYAVVAPDYAGLGISTSWDGSNIPHQYLVSPTSARDALFALQATLAAFPGMLSQEFVVVGHSQGGGVAWAVSEVLAAEQQFTNLSQHHLGTVAASPTTDVFGGVPQFILPWLGLALNTIFPAFQFQDWLTPVGIARTKLLKEIDGGISVSTQLFLSGEPIIKDDWKQTWYVDAIGRLSNAGRKMIKKPLLVIQGTEDLYVPYAITNKTVHDTCATYPDSQLEFLVVNGTGHVPTLSATRRIWLKWIEDRFNGHPLDKEACSRTKLESFLPVAQYAKVGTSYPQWAGSNEYSYELPLAA